jgi:hypothetical protein
MFLPSHPKLLPVRITGKERLKGFFLRPSLGFDRKTPSPVNILERDLGVKGICHKTTRYCVILFPQGDSRSLNPVSLGSRKIHGSFQIGND